MTKVNNHIQKLIFEIDIPEQSGAFELQNRISSLSKEKLMPRLNQLFEDLIPEDEYVYIDRLEVNIGHFSEQELDNVFFDEIIKALKQEIQDKFFKNQGDVERTHLPVSLFKKWLFFLETGILNQSKEVFAEETEVENLILTQIKVKPDFKNQFKSLLVKNIPARRRLIFQHKEDFILELLSHFQNNIKILIQETNTVIDEIIDFQFKSERNEFALSKKDVIFWKAFKKKLAKFRQDHLTYQDKLIIASLTEKINQLQTHDLLYSFFDHLFSYKEIATCIIFFTKKNHLEKTTKLKNIQIILKKIKQEYFTNKNNKSLDSNQQFLTPKNKLNQSEIQNQIDDLMQNDQMLNEKLKPDFATPDSNQIDTTNTQNGASDSNQINKLNTQNEFSDSNPNNKPNTQNESSDFFKEEQTKAGQITDFDDQPTNTAHYLENAGTILIHPFLHRFFVKLDLIDGTDFKDETSRTKAVHLLAFLATKREEHPEYSLLFSKFLCGYPAGMPIPKSVEITTTEKAEAEKLLEAVITHWGALGETSPDGLREGFLQRPGKLSKTSMGWCLQVEGKTLDILLNQLPWTLSLVKLPWMKEMLRVEWL